MYVDRYTIKSEARERLRDAEPRPYYEGLIYTLLTGAMLALSAFILGGKITPEASEKYLSLLMAGAYDKATDYLYTLSPSSLDTFVSSILQMFQGILSIGFLIFALHTLRREEASLWNLLDVFSRFFPFLLLVILSHLLVSLWAQLLLIPGIIAFYRYRMSVFLMIDHPQLGALPSLLLSGQLMRGHKWELFVLDLSFIGWFLLALLPLLCGVLFGWLGLLLGALGSTAVFAWLAPYHALSCAGFYEAIRSTMPVPPEQP